MYRIGIIGTENSHALAFAKIFNTPDLKLGEFIYPDARVVGIYGPDHESEVNICKQCNIEFVANTPQDFFGKVDAMMITCRKGSVHASYAMPFIEKGIPVFIDKPFTCDINEANTLIETAKGLNVPLTGGSGCKYAYDVLALENHADELKRNGEFLTGCINYSADKNSVYDGLYFYAPHLVEMALTIFGYDMQSVKAFERENVITVIARYKAYDITMNFTNSTNDAACIIIGKKDNFYRQIDISTIYALEVERFITM
ncbi:MAG: Gfo/Idh/MocA family oxidoreductase, partial [Oscillospiraceae bacterium]